MQRKGVDFEELLRHPRGARPRRRRHGLLRGARAWCTSCGRRSREFDDYIAKPKGNDYRSLHTAVIGPEGKTLEVQIRTHEMHQHAELGVAAHWRYKEGGGRTTAAFDEKIAWMRQLLDGRRTSDARRACRAVRDASSSRTASTC